MESGELPVSGVGFVTGVTTQLLNKPHVVELAHSAPAATIIALPFLRRFLILTGFSSWFP